MATWHVRPDASHGGANNGTSYSDAWGGWSQIVWGGTKGVSLGDTLYICGGYSSSINLFLGAHGAANDSQQVTLRGDYPGDAGSFLFTGTGYLNSTRNYTTFKRLKITGMTGFACILHSAAAGGIIEECELVGGTDGVRLNSSTAFTSVTVRNNIIHGQSGMGINHTVGTGSITPSNILISGNTVYEAAVYGIQVSVNSSAWTTSRFDKYYIRNNKVRDCPGGSVYFRSCHNDTVTAPTIYSTDIEVSGNTVDRCGTIAGAAGAHGGITVMGAASPMIFGNTVRDTYVTGAGIQTAKNISTQIFNNRVSGIRSGTPVAAFQNGFPIDGNGIFFDNLTIGGVAHGNRISNLVSTGNPNSGTGLSIWDSTSVTFVGNVVVDCYRGANYGRANESGNAIINNTFVRCDVGIDKVGVNPLAGNTLVKNNLIKDCATGLRSGPNPSIEADYNNVYGSATPYSGVVAGVNDTNIDPHFDDNYQARNSRLKRVGTYLGGKDFNGKQFYNPPSIGAVDDLSTTPRKGFVSAK